MWYTPLPDRFQGHGPHRVGITHRVYPQMRPPAAIGEDRCIEFAGRHLHTSSRIPSVKKLQRRPNISRKIKILRELLGDSHGPKLFS